MTRLPEFHIKKITLPSGKVVEIVYLHPTAEPPPDAHEHAVRIHRIELCPACGGERVHPLEWHEVSEDRWQLEVRCPDCRWRTTDVFDHADVQRYDDLLAADTDRLIAELDRVTRENMEEHLERFRHALEHDVIEPMDF